MEDSTVRHPTFYLQHGDLIIESARDDEGTVTVYRVSKALLAFNSPVFADMLGFTGEDELYDGLPIVRLSDSAEELSALMSALYDPSAVFLPRFDPDKPLRLTPIMRLAVKYQMDALRQRIIDVIRADWPETLEEWVRYKSEVCAIRRMHKPSEAVGFVGTPVLLEDHLPEPASAVRFARDFDVPSIIPIAYYTLTGLSRYNDWDTIHVGQPLVAIGPGDRTLCARWPLLDQLDLKVVMRLKEMLATRTANIIETYCGEVSLGQLMRELKMVYPTCDTPTRCVDEMNRLTTKWRDEDFEIQDVLQYVQCPDPLSILEKLYNTNPTWKLCRGCKGRLQKHITDAQGSLWEQIRMMVDIFERSP